jgi:hypothetical protein
MELIQVHVSRQLMETLSLPWTILVKHSLSWSTKTKESPLDYCIEEKKPTFFLKDLGWLLAYYEKSYMYKTRLQVPEVQNQQTAASGWRNQSGGKITIQTPLIQLPSYREEGYNGSVSCNPAELITALCSRNSTSASIHECILLPMAGWRMNANWKKDRGLGATTVTQNATLNFCTEYTFSFFWASKRMKPLPQEYMCSRSGR